MKGFRFGRGTGTAGKSAAEQAGEGRTQYFSDAGKLASLLVLALFIVRIVMTYIIRCDSAPLSNMRRTEYVLIFAWAVLSAVRCVLALLSGGDEGERMRRSLRRLNCPEQWILLGLLVWGILSCVSMNSAYKGDWTEANRYAMEDMAISILVFFPMTVFFEERDTKRLLMFCLHLMAAVITVLMAVVLWNVFHGRTIRLPQGTVRMLKNRTLSISANRNTVGAYAVFTALMCPLLALTLRRPLARLAYVPAFLIHWMIMCLTQSATSLAVGSLIGAMMLAAALMRFGAGGPLWKRLAFAGGCAAAAMAVLWLSRAWIVTLYAKSVQTPSTDSAASAASAASSFVRDMGGNTTLSGRVRIWQAAVKAMFGNNGSETTFRNALFGYTFAGCPEVINALCKRNMYTHNQYLEMGVCMGVPAFLAYLAFSVFEAAQCIRVGLADRGKVTLAERWVPLMVLGLVVANLTEAMLLGNAYMPGCFFFILCGWCSRRGRELGWPSWMLKRMPVPGRKKASKNVR